jgi:hypothetical protein
MEHITHYLPSKKFTIIVLVLLVLFVVSSYFFTKTEQYTSQEPAPTPTHTEEELADFSSDADGDGLAMWEEALWGTNPDVADSDGDGTQDGIEIAARRNPLINQSDDSLESYPLVPGSAEDVNDASSTRTNALTRAFMSSLYASSQKEGGTTAEDMEILNTLLATEVLQNAITDPYTQSDILLGDDSDETFRTYANALGALIGEYNSLGDPYELTIISEAITNEHIEDLRQLERFATFFRESAESIRLLSAPISLAETHLTLLNSVAIMAESLSRIALTENDIVLGFAGLAQYQTTLAAFWDSVDTVVAEITTRTISFSPSEPGHIFVPSSE